MCKAIEAVIIDDEESFVSSTEIILRQNFPEVKLIGSAGTVREGVSLIKNMQPNLVFLDIHLPDGLGFDLLDQTDFTEFETVFTTSYSEHALRAFEFSALHYLVKPLELEKLRQALERFSFESDLDLIDQKFDLLKENLQERPRRVLLPTGPGRQEVINIQEIIRCEAYDNYTQVYISGRKAPLLICRTLKKFEEMLGNLGFARSHASHLINLDYVAMYNPGRHAHVTLRDRSQYPISQSYRGEFLKKLQRRFIAF